MEILDIIEEPKQTYVQYKSNNKEGTITLDSFCDLFGYQPKEVYEELNQAKTSLFKEESDD